MSDEDNELQEIVLQDACRIYSETVIDHFMHPRNMGVLSDEDGYARITGPCGDAMEMWIKEQQGSIVRANFMTDGCGTSIASGSMATVLATGKTLAEAQQINQQTILEDLNWLFAESQHCALVAANTLKAAVQDYLAKRR